MASTKTDALAEEYERLPEAIKSKYSIREYAWLGDQGRARIIDDECLPEVGEDG